MKVKVFKKKCKNLTSGHISDVISPTDFIFYTKVQPNKAHSMTQVLLTLTEDQGQWSRSKFSIISKKLINLIKLYAKIKKNGDKRSQIIQTLTNCQTSSVVLSC